MGMEVESVRYVKSKPNACEIHQKKKRKKKLQAGFASLGTLAAGLQAWKAHKCALAKW